MKLLQELRPLSHSGCAHRQRRSCQDVKILNYARKQSWKTAKFHETLSGKLLFPKGIVSRDFGVLFMISLDCYEVRTRAEKGLFFYWRFRI
jgi:hypothetical protein